MAESDDEYIELKPVPVVWLAVLYGIFALVAVLIFAFWDAIPDPMATHWNYLGRPDSWTEKSPGAVFGQVAIGAIPLGLLTPVIIYATHNQAKQAHNSFPRKTTGEVNRARATSNEMVPTLAKFMVGIVAVVMGAIVTGLFGLFHGPWFSALLISALVLLIVWFALDMRSAQRRIAEVAGHDEVSRHMRWGMFYYNPDDERLMVDHTMGATVNFARPGAWLFLAALLLPVAIVVIIAVAMG